MFENHPKCSIFEFWHFSPIFVLLKSDLSGTNVWLQASDSKSRQIGPLTGIFNELLCTKNVKVARFARNVE